MLISRTSFLLCCKVLIYISDRITCASDVGSCEGNAVGITRKYTVIMHGVVSCKTCTIEICKRSTTQGLEDHRTENLPMSEFFGAHMIHIILRLLFSILHFKCLYQPQISPAHNRSKSQYFCNYSIHNPV